MTVLLQQQAPWLVERVLIPAIFLLLGSVIAFVAGQLTAWMDRRRAKEGFLKAVRLELLGLEEQLKASLAEIQGSMERLQRGAPTPPQLVGTLRTSVFISQLSRLAASDLADETIIKIVQLYSDLPVLLQMIETLNRNSSDLSKDDGSAQQAHRVSKVLSIVRVMAEQFIVFITRIHALTEKLPKATP